MGRAAASLCGPSTGKIALRWLQNQLTICSLEIVVNQPQPSGEAVLSAVLRPVSYHRPLFAHMVHLPRTKEQQSQLQNKKAAMHFPECK